ASALPGKLKLGIAAAVAASLFPLALAARARVSFSDQPRIHLLSDMDDQPKLRAQAASEAFADGRAMRQPVEGTVAVGGAHDDDTFYRGVKDGVWATTLPTEVHLDRATLERGRERFGIYCAPCHGQAGYGDGMVARRAEKIGASKWVTPTSLHEAHVRDQPVGQLFHAITSGVRTMPAYGHAIPERDRWAIVAYVRALQLSQAASRADVPPSATIDSN
ncbi:MAG: cytochrome c, partial [Myxococcales bacterium]|nr:cytochrome c [Myxococcales bacterium]